MDKRYFILSTLSNSKEFKEGLLLDAIENKLVIYTNEQLKNNKLLQELTKEFIEKKKSIEIFNGTAVYIDKDSNYVGIYKRKATSKVFDLRLSWYSLDSTIPKGIINSNELDKLASTTEKINKNTVGHIVTNNKKRDNVQDNIDIVEETKQCTEEISDDTKGNKEQEQEVSEINTTKRDEEELNYYINLLKLLHKGNRISIKKSIFNCIKKNSKYPIYFDSNLENIVSIIDISIDDLSTKTITICCVEHQNSDFLDIEILKEHNNYTLSIASKNDFKDNYLKWRKETLYLRV